MKFDAKTVFKSVSRDMRSHHYFPLPGTHGSHGWPLPGEKKWVGPAGKKPLRPHHWGLHLARKDGLIYWLGDRNFIAEHKGHAEYTKDVVVAEFVRLKQEVFISNQSLIDLAIEYCNEVKDIGTLLDFDWTIGKTMSESFNASASYLHKDLTITKKAQDLATLCKMNSDLRLNDSLNSFDYVHGCQSVAHASRALSLLPLLDKNGDNVKNIRLFKQIAYDCRMAISYAIEQHHFYSRVNGREHPLLPDSFLKWCKHDKGGQPHHRALVKAGEWQNKKLLKKIEPEK